MESVRDTFRVHSPSAYYWRHYIQLDCTMINSLIRKFSVLTIVPSIWHCTSLERPLNATHESCGLFTQLHRFRKICKSIGWDLLTRLIHLLKKTLFLLFLPLQWICIVGRADRDWMVAYRDIFPSCRIAKNHFFIAVFALGFRSDFERWRLWSFGNQFSWLFIHHIFFTRVFFWR